MPIQRVISNKKKFQKTLALAAGASNPHEAKAAERAARQLMEEHKINPVELCDESLYDGQNFASNTLFQKLREEYQAAHPPKADQLVWKVDWACSVGDTVVYKAEQYSLATYVGKVFAGHVTTYYSVHFGNEQLNRGFSSSDAKAFAQRHYKRRLKEAKAQRATPEQVFNATRMYAGMFDDFLPESSVNTTHEVETTEAPNCEFQPEAMPEQPVNTNNKSKPAKPVNTNPRNRDRHSPNYMRDYMRRRRARKPPR
jgi:hypothetical protein